MAGLYIHVPFCRSKCAYCDFYSIAEISAFSDSYAHALHNEFLNRKGEISEPFSTIYIGGGTPSALSLRHIDAMAKWLPKVEGEFTVEVNPDDVSDELIKHWRQIGVNRVSMGVQSLNDAELRAVGRRHDAAGALQAYDIIRRYIDNVSLDIIIGLPGQTMDTLARTLEQMISIRPEHISAYILSYEEGTPLYRRLIDGEISEVPQETVAQMYLFVSRRLREAGYIHYEVSNFALPAFRAVHNSSYWFGAPYLGLGPAAHSFGSDGVRRSNPANVKDWLDAVQNNLTTVEDDGLDPVVNANTAIMLRLRTAQGLSLADIPEVYRQKVLDKANKLPEGRILVKNAGTRNDLADVVISVPVEGWLMLNDTTARLFL